MGRIIVILSVGWLLLGNSTLVQGQYISVQGLGFLGLVNNSGAEYFYNGFGFELNYQQVLKKGRVSVGLEYRSINWGYQAALQLGYDYPYWQQGPWRASAFGHAHLGAALYVQRSLFAWGAALGTGLEWQSPKAFFARLSLGAGLSHCPAYENYGRINTTLDLPIKLGIGFKLLGNKKEK